MSAVFAVVGGIALGVVGTLVAVWAWLVHGFGKWW